MDKLYLDDLHVGDTFESREIQISEEQIIEFASLYDPQPFHIDPDAARATFFGRVGRERVAHDGDHDAADRRERPYRRWHHWRGGRGNLASPNPARRRSART